MFILLQCQWSHNHDQTKSRLNWWFKQTSNKCTLHEWDAMYILEALDCCFWSKMWVLFYSILTLQWSITNSNIWFCSSIMKASILTLVIIWLVNQICKMMFLNFTIHSCSYCWPHHTIHHAWSSINWNWCAKMVSTVRDSPKTSKFILNWFWAAVEATYNLNISAAANYSCNIITQCWYSIANLLLYK